MTNSALVVAAEKAVAEILAKLERDLGQEVTGIYINAVEIGVCGMAGPHWQRHVSIELWPPTGRCRWA